MLHTGKAHGQRGADGDAGGRGGRARWSAAGWPTASAAGRCSSARWRVLPPLIVGFLISAPGWRWCSPALAGAATIATFAVTIVMGQEFLPGRIGVAVRA